MVDIEPDDLLARLRIRVVTANEHAVSHPYLDDLAGLRLGLVGGEGYDHFPRGALVSGARGVGIPVAVGKASVDLGQSLVQEIDAEVAPDLGRLPRLNGLDLIAIRIEIGCVA